MHFTKEGISVPRLKEPVTDPNSELILILFLHRQLGAPKSILSPCFVTKPLHSFLFLSKSVARCAFLIFLDLSTVKNREAPPYAVITRLPLIPPS
jgi:hypothetical protein